MYHSEGIKRGKYVGMRNVEQHLPWSRLGITIAIAISQQRKPQSRPTDQRHQPRRLRTLSAFQDEAPQSRFDRTAQTIETSPAPMIDANVVRYTY
jgi:hypothetical protein